MFPLCGEAISNPPKCPIRCKHARIMIMTIIFFNIEARFDAEPCVGLRTGLIVFHSPQNGPNTVVSANEVPLAIRQNVE